MFNNILDLFEELNQLTEANDNVALTNEEKTHLQDLIKNINEYVTVTPSWQTASANHIKLVKQPDMMDVDTEDHFEWDDYDECYVFQEDRVIEQYKESLYNEEFYWIADVLGISEQEYNAAVKAKQPMQIPNSPWKLDPDIEVEIIGTNPTLYQVGNDPGDYWNPPDYSVELDKDEMKLQASVYLVK